MSRRVVVWIVVGVLLASPGCATIALWDDSGAAARRRSFPAKAALTLPVLASETLYLTVACALDFVIPPLGAELLLRYMEAAERSLEAAERRLERRRSQE